MVGNVTIQGQITGTATFDGAKISAVVTVSPPINATVNFGGGISAVEQLPAPVSDSSNVYAWIRGTLLTGLAALSDSAITATDTVLQGFAKLQGQLNAVKVRLGLLEDDLIYEVLTTAPTTSITISIDKNGQPFSLHECVVYLMHPSWPSNLLFLRINNISANVYNSYINVNISRFQTLLGELGGEAKVNLRYDNEVNTVIFNSMSSRYQTSGAYASVISCGYINFGKINTPITRIDVLPSAGVIPAGTKIVLKKK